jgi:hypothetical protein
VMKRMGEQFFRYVPDHRVEAYRHIGWIVLEHFPICWNRTWDSFTRANHDSSEGW